MGEVFVLALSFPSVVFTVLLGVVLIYWAFVMVGVIHIGEGSEGALDGHIDGATKGLMEGAVDHVGGGTPTSVISAAATATPFSVTAAMAAATVTPTMAVRARWRR